MYGDTTFDDRPALTKAHRRYSIGALVEGALAFSMVLPLLFAGQINSAAPAICFAFALGYAYYRRRDMVHALGTRWPLLLMPALALASTFWSDYPLVTARHAVELLIIVLGAILLSASERPASVLAGIWAAFTVFLLASLALGHSVTVGLAGATRDTETAFAGLNQGKNLLGATAGMGVLASAFLLAVSVRRRSLVGAALAAVSLLLALYLTYLARSAGATIAAILALLAFFAFSLLGAFRTKVRAFVGACLLVFVGAAGLWASAFTGSVTATALDLFHKDPTLTGRSYLWYRAAGLIHDRPWLGRGFEGFWVQGNIDAEGFWQYAGVTERMGFNFHNTLIELLIDFGYIGGVLLIALFVVACAALLRRALVAPTLTAAFCVAFVVFNVARMPFESIALNAVDITTLLMFLVLGYGFGRPLRRLAPASPPAGLARRPRPRPIRVVTG